MGLLHCRQILNLLNDKGSLPTLGLSVSEVSAPARGRDRRGGQREGAPVSLLVSPDYPPPRSRFPPS